MARGFSVLIFFDLDKDIIGLKTAVSFGSWLLGSNYFHLGNLADPTGGPFIAGSDNAERPFFGGKRLAVTLIGKNDFAGGECGIGLGESVGDVVSVSGPDEQDFRESRSAHGVSELNSG
jgi:hypothetical protein